MISEKILSKIEKGYFLNLFKESAESLKTYSVKDGERYRDLVRKEKQFGYFDEEDSPNGITDAEMAEKRELARKFNKLRDFPVSELEPWQAELFKVKKATDKEQRYRTGPKNLIWSPYMYNNKVWGGEDKNQGLRVEKLLGTPAIIFNEKLLGALNVRGTDIEKDAYFKQVLRPLFDAETYSKNKTVDDDRSAVGVLQRLLNSEVLPLFNHSSIFRSGFGSLPSDLNGALGIVYNKFLELGVTPSFKGHMIATATLAKFRRSYSGLLQKVDRQIALLFDPSFYRDETEAELTPEDKLKKAVNHFKSILDAAKKELDRGDEEIGKEPGITVSTLKKQADTYEDYARFLNFAQAAFERIDVPLEKRPDFLTIATNAFGTEGLITNLELEDLVLQNMKDAALRKITTIRADLPSGLSRVLTTSVNSTKTIGDFDAIEQLLLLERFSQSDVFSLLLKAFKYNITGLLSEILTSRDIQGEYQISKELSNVFNTVKGFNEVEQILQDNLVIKCKVNGASAMRIENILADTMVGHLLTIINSSGLDDKTKKTIIKKIEKEAEKTENYNILFNFLEAYPENFNIRAVSFEVRKAIKQEAVDQYIKFYNDRIKNTSRVCLLSAELFKDRLISEKDINVIIKLTQQNMAGTDYESTDFYNSVRKALLEFIKLYLRYIIKKDNYLYADEVDADIKTKINPIKSFKEIESVIKEIFPAREIDLDSLRLDIKQAALNAAANTVKKEASTRQSTESGTLRRSGRSAVLPELTKIKSFEDLQNYVKAIEGGTGLEKITYATGDRADVSKIAQRMILATRETPRRKRTAIQALDNMFTSERIKKFIYDRYLKYKGFGATLGYR